MDELPQTQVQEIGHLGLIAAVVKKYGIKEKIDLLLPKESNNQKITHGEAILAMIYQGLGFGDGRLYFAKDFFSNKVAFRSFFNHHSRGYPIAPSSTKTSSI